jgi:hypothetical protein
MTEQLFEIRVNAAYDRFRLLAILADNGYTVRIETRVIRKTFNDRDYFVVVTDEPDYPEYREAAK